MPKSPFMKNIYRVTLLTSTVYCRTPPKCSLNLNLPVLYPGFGRSLASMWLTTARMPSLNFVESSLSRDSTRRMTSASSEGTGNVTQSIDGKNVLMARATLSLGFSSKPPPLGFNNLS